MKKVICLLFALTTIVGFSGSVFAGEAPHPVQLGDIKGPGVDLKMHDHAVAGAIKDFVMWGYVDEGTFSAEMTMRKDAQVIRSNFKKQEDGRYGGVIQHQVDGKDVVTSIYLTKIVGAERKIILDLNGAELVATIQPESVTPEHMVNPTITIRYNGQELTYRMQGEGCFGYLMYNTMMIAGAYFH